MNMTLFSQHCDNTLGLHSSVNELVQVVKRSVGNAVIVAVIYVEFCLQLSCVNYCRVSQMACSVIWHAKAAYLFTKNYQLKSALEVTETKMYLCLV